MQVMQHYRKHGTHPSKMHQAWSEGGMGPLITIPIPKINPAPSQHDPRAYLRRSASTTKDRKQEWCLRSKRLMEITIREAATLIWQLRNIYVIQKEGDESQIPTLTEIHSQFLFQLNHHMQLDVTLTNKYKFGRQALPKSMVLDTRLETIELDEPLDNWTTVPRVLVGIEPPE